jgi:hypothetical protein
VHSVRKRKQTEIGEGLLLFCSEYLSSVLLFEKLKFAKLYIFLFYFMVVKGGLTNSCSRVEYKLGVSENCVPTIF